MQKTKKVRLTQKRKQRLLNEYGNSVPALTKEQIEWCLNDTARYIWFDNKDFYNGHCECCDNDVTFDIKTRHRKKVTCPKCGKEMEIRHKWRVSYTGNTDFRVITTVHNGNEIFMRYVLINQCGQKRSIFEVAREICNFTLEDRREMEYVGGEWKFGNSRRWFTMRAIYGYRKDCVLWADAYMPNLATELKKLDGLKYIDDPSKYINKTSIVSTQIRYLVQRASIYEKLEKVGLTEFAVKEFDNFLNAYIYEKTLDTEQTELVKVLRLTKENYRLWHNEYKTLEALHFLQKYPTIKKEVLDYVLANGIDTYKYSYIHPLTHQLKALRYVKENGITEAEYAHYVHNLKTCNYKSDKANLFPKNFKEMDKKVADECVAITEKKKAEERKVHSELIKKISDGLRNKKNLQQFFNGSEGLLVYVPESAEELIAEGKALHNCIGTYVKRVAEGKTLVFFVRELNAPDKPYVAFEYCDGRIIQIRYDYNEPVYETKIVSFVNKFTAQLAA